MSNLKKVIIVGAADNMAAKDIGRVCKKFGVEVVHVPDEAQIEIKPKKEDPDEKDTIK